MKIGILTQPLHANYGGILQNYALQCVLKQLGHEVWTIDYGKYTWLDWLDNAWRVLAHKLLGHHATFEDTPTEWQSYGIPLRNFVHKYIDITEPYTKRIRKDIIKKYSLDALVVGSDQVWRPKYNRRIEDCYLKFALGSNIRRVAYGASFGTDEWEYTNKQTKRCATLVKKFSGISVREKTGISLCAKYLNVKATHVLDPTLLLYAEDYNQLCLHIPKRKSFVFAYILDESEEKTREVKAFSERKGLPYIIKSAGGTISSNDTIELWLSYFRDAEFIVTDSFHGTVFSVIFNKDFYVWGNETRGNSRFESLLDMFDLKDRMVNNILSNKAESINWKKVNDKKENAIKNSKLWLMRNLNICQR